MELQGRYGEIRDLDAEVLAISTDDLNDSKSLVESVGIEFPVLYNPEADVVRQYGVFNLLGDGLATTSTFIVDKSGRIRFMHIGEHIGDQASTSRIFDVLRSLRDS